MLLKRIGGQTGPIHEDDRDRLARARDEAVAAHAPYCATFRLYSEGAWRWFEERAFPIGGRSGRSPEWVGTLSEIHDRGEAIDALRQNEVHLLATVAAIGVGMWTVDLVAGTWTWSAELKAILGLPAGAEASDQAVLDRIHPADRLRSAGDDASREAAGLANATFRILRADTGEQRWVVSVSRSIADRDGRPARVVGTLQDITDRKRAELEREASEVRLNAALKIGRMIVWDLDLASGIVTRSVNAQELLGSKREPIVQFVERVHPDDRGMVTWESSENPTPPTGDIRFRYLHPDGSLLWLETSAIKITAADAPGHIVGITTDVTGRQLSEEKLIHAAHHDPLTGLMNRKAWSHHLDRIIASAAIGLSA